MVGLVLAGLGLGIFIGGLGESKPELLVETVEITATAKTVTKTRTRTVTVPVAETAVGAVTTGPDGFVTTATATTPTTAVSCSSDYEGACVDANADDVSCSQIPDRDFESVGSDPYFLDPDEDGLACED